MRANDALGQPRHQARGVVEMQTDVLQRPSVDRGERLGHAVDEGLDADERRCRGRAFACAIIFSPPPKPISSATSLTGTGNSALARPERDAKIERKPRQQRVEKLGLLRTQLVTLAPAEEGARVMLFGIPSQSWPNAARLPQNSFNELVRGGVLHLPDLCFSSHVMANDAARRRSHDAWWPA